MQAELEQRSEKRVAVLFRKARAALGSAREGQHKRRLRRFFATDGGRGGVGSGGGDSGEESDGGASRRTPLPSVLAALEALTSLTGGTRAEQAQNVRRAARRGGLPPSVSKAQLKEALRRDEHASRAEELESMAKTLQEKMKGRQSTEDVLTLAQVRRFSRKARDYRDGYLLPELANSGTLAQIEKLRVKCKAHRCTLDQDFKFCTAGL